MFSEGIWMAGFAKPVSKRAAVVVVEGESLTLGF